MTRLQLWIQRLYWRFKSSRSLRVIIYQHHQPVLSSSTRSPTHYTQLNRLSTSSAGIYNCQCSILYRRRELIVEKFPLVPRNLLFQISKLWSLRTHLHPALVVVYYCRYLRLYEHVEILGASGQTVMLMPCDMYKQRMTMCRSCASECDIYKQSPIMCVNIKTDLTNTRIKKRPCCW